MTLHYIRYSKSLEVSSLITKSPHPLIQRSPVRFWAQCHTCVMDYDEACFMHRTPGVVHNFIKAVGIQFLSPMHKKFPIQKEQGTTPGILVSCLSNRW